MYASNGQIKAKSEGPNDTGSQANSTSVSRVIREANTSVASKSEAVSKDGKGENCTWGGRVGEDRFSDPSAVSVSKHGERSAGVWPSVSATARTSSRC